VDETIEQFEERVLNKRAAQMFLSVRQRLHKKESIFLTEMTYRNSKKQVIEMQSNKRSLEATPFFSHQDTNIFLWIFF
jgi:hypothetical protein